VYRERAAGDGEVPRQGLQVEGEVQESKKSVISNDWLLKLRGHRMPDGDFASVMCLFP